MYVTCSHIVLWHDGIYLITATSCDEYTKYVYNTCFLFGTTVILSKQSDRVDHIIF